MDHVPTAAASLIRARRPSRRRGSLESSHAPTARFRTYRQGAWLFAWVALGIVSYGGVWVSFTTGEKRSFSAVANLNLQLEQEYQSLQEERSKQISLQKKKRLTKPSEKEKQQRKKQSDREHRWAALGLWMAVVILSYHRIKRFSESFFNIKRYFPTTTTGHASNPSHPSRSYRADAEKN
jgi:cbb3-type cytochrome oxidase subunit 3